MLPFSLTERKDMLYEFIRCNRNASKAAKNLNNRSICRRRVLRQRIIDTVRKFEKTFSLHDAQRIGRPRISTNEATASQILQVVAANPESSITELSQECGTSRYAVHKVLQERKFRPYQHKILQILNSGDANLRKTFCRWYANNGNPQFTLFTDEAPFRLHMFLRNRHSWSVENPHKFEAGKSVSKSKLMVWAGIFGNRLIGPYFFDKAVTGNEC